MLRNSNAPIVLVRQMACYPASKYENGSLDARVSWPEQREDQRTAAYVYRLHEFDFVNAVVPEYGSPCSPYALPKLFQTNEAPGQHLGDLGARLLGEYVASELVRNWDAVFDPARRASTPQPPAYKEKCFYADEAGASCAAGEACSIDGAFAPQGEGWAYKAKTGGRRDKICWQADVPGVALTTVDPVDFVEVVIYAGERAPAPALGAARRRGLYASGQTHPQTHSPNPPTQSPNLPHPPQTPPNPSH
jgi:hypothetical protein